MIPSARRGNTRTDSWSPRGRTRRRRRSRPGVPLAPSSGTWWLAASSAAQCVTARSHRMWKPQRRRQRLGVHRTAASRIHPSKASSTPPSAGQRFVNRSPSVPIGASVPRSSSLRSRNPLRTGSRTTRTPSQTRSRTAHARDQRGRTCRPSAAGSRPTMTPPDHSPWTPVAAALALRSSRAAPAGGAAGGRPRRTRRVLPAPPGRAPRGGSGRRGASTSSRPASRSTWWTTRRAWGGGSRPSPRAAWWTRPAVTHTSVSSTNGTVITTSRTSAPSMSGAEGRRPPSSRCSRRQLMIPCALPAGHTTQEAASLPSLATEPVQAEWTQVGKVQSIEKAVRMFSSMAHNETPETGAYRQTIAPVCAPCGPCEISSVRLEHWQDQHLSLKAHASVPRACQKSSEASVCPSHAAQRT
mmetsp:Transcript_46176/g.143037  ORF Transcript_46176/g.143037 Transcript_46176/m.143037 type:complete len:412 (-) Transcript_46176:180-1415(-)